MNIKNKYQILLYYHYTKIDDPEKFKIKHHHFCIENNLRGRIIISKEGLNGTISGLENDCKAYMNYVSNNIGFKDIEFKIDYHYEHAFKKLNVRLKDEIVNSGLKNLNPKGKAGKYLEPQEFQNIKDQNNVLLLDVRSNYEYNQGAFKNSISLDLNNFREFPQKINELQKFKNKKIITMCTGGIKCEKASAYLLEQGFKNVYQLHGGIIKYGLETDGKDFEGKCYVFDNRISVAINKYNPSTKNKCHICKNACDRMINCANSKCNFHIPICKSCSIQYDGCCSDDCKKSPHKRKYNGTGYYSKQLNGYNPYKGLKKLNK